MSISAEIETGPGEFHLVEDGVSVNHFMRDGRSLPFIVLPGIFRPDEWTAFTIEAAMNGLDRSPKLRRVLDIGSGSGVIPLVLSWTYPDRQLDVVCCDLKKQAGRNLILNYQLIGGNAPCPAFHCLDIRETIAPFSRSSPPDLIVANVPQLPAHAYGDGGQTDWNPDDYQEPRPGDLDDPVRAFGLGLLTDSITGVSALHTSRFSVAFCRSSRVPGEVFDAFLDRVNGTVLHLGPWCSVRDGSTPYDLLAAAEERYGLSGDYRWNGKSVPTTALRHTTPEREDVRIQLRSCLIQVG